MMVHGQSTCDGSHDNVNVFLSYAHEDRDLLSELRKHLSSLRKASLLVDWCDRLINPGAEWKIEIQSAIERADIILLLLSPDFFVSEYCDFETQLALARYNRHQATLLPILLRPVVWQDACFAGLQILPSDGTPVTEWPSQDRAFCDIAATIRELILHSHFAKRSPVFHYSPVPKQRFLDAAISPLATVGESTDLVAMIRTADSEGLRAILRIDKNYSIAEQEVVSQQFEIDFPTASEISSAKPLDIVVEAPSFDPPYKKKTIGVPSGADSSPCVFLLTPRKPGRQQLTLEIIDSGKTMASRVLCIEVVTESSDQHGYDLLSSPLLSSGLYEDKSAISKERYDFSLSYIASETPKGEDQCSYEITVTLRRPGKTTDALPAKVRTFPGFKLEVAGPVVLVPGERVSVLTPVGCTEAVVGEAIGQEGEVHYYTLREPDGKSNRTEIRLPTSLPAMVHLADSAKGIEGKVVNISGNGMALEFSSDLEPGIKLGVELGEKFAVGEVRHSHETDGHSYISGIKLEKFVSKHAAKPQVPGDFSKTKAACLAELAEVQKELAKGTIKDADRLAPLVERYREIVEKS